MNRSDESLFDTRIADWLEDDPYAAPDEALDVVLAAVPSIKQRRARRVPWRFSNVNGMTRIAMTAGTVVAVAVGGLYVLNRGASGPGGPATPPPSPSPTAVPSPSLSPSASASLLDPSRWVTYRSARYGFSIGYPDTWSTRSAERDWTFDEDAADWQSPGQESFISPTADVRVSAWSLPVEPGTDAEAWVLAYCEAATDPPIDCAEIVDGKLPVFVELRDQHPGLLLTSPAWDIQAFFLNADRMHVVAIWRGESDPSVAPYGGARRLLEAFLSTMILGAPEAASPEPS